MSEAPANAGGVVWLDVSDLLDYIDGNSSVSGIQRVVTALIPELPVIDAASARSENAAAPRFALCKFDFRRQLFLNVEPGDFDAKLRAFRVGGAPRSWNPLATLARRRAAKAGGEHVAVSAIPCAFQAADVLVCLGVFWFRPMFAHALVATARARGLKLLMSVHDLIPLRFPEWVNKEVASIWLSAFDTAMRGADSLLFFSRHARDDAAAWCADNGVAMPPSRVVRLGDAINPVVAREPVGEHRVRSHGNYVLSVAGITARKNVDLLVKVWELLSSRHGDLIPPLTIVGKSGDGGEEILRRVKRANSRRKLITVLGNVKDAELAEYYRGALFTMMPSRMEGWGLPVAESLSFGRFCLASNAGSIPEVGGDLVAYFDPGDVEGCAALVEKYAFDAEERARAEARIAAEYRPTPWSSTAAELVAECGRLLSPGADGRGRAGGTD